MKTWNDYKKHVKEVDPEMGREISKIEENTEIISAIVMPPITTDIVRGCARKKIYQKKKRTWIKPKRTYFSLQCPQSSIARIESQSSVPKLDTLLKIFDKLGLMISITPKTAAH